MIGYIKRSRPDNTVIICPKTTIAISETLRIPTSLRANDIIHITSAVEPTFFTMIGSTVTGITPLGEDINGSRLYLVTTGGDFKIQNNDSESPLYYQVIRKQ